jgi:hypothetical protein
MASTGYSVLHRPLHPLAPPSGQLHVHRIVLYDAIGPGAHQCHSCGVEVNWRTATITGKGSLVVDHLDGNPRNNTLTNLAPACHPCNTRRGYDVKMADVPVLVTQRGYRKTAVERVCIQCSEPFLVAKTSLECKGATNTGEYCSRQCQNTAQAKAQANRVKALSAPAIPRIMEMRGQGESYQGIATRLDQEGFKPPRGDRWSKATVYVIVKREQG